MNRRDAIGALLATLVAPGAMPIRAYGQTRVRRIVFVTGAPERTLADWLQGFREGMKDLGYQEGRNITVDYRYGGVDGVLSGPMAADWFTPSSALTKRRRSRCGSWTLPIRRCLRASHGRVTIF